MKEMEGEGKTVAEAVENALKSAGLRRDQVEVQTLREASSGFMGLGVKTAIVRISEKRWAADGSPLPPEPPAPAPRAKAPARPAVSRPEPRPEPRPEARPEPSRAPQRSRHERRPEPPRSRQHPPAAAAARPPREHSIEQIPLTADQTAKACEQAASLLKDILPLMKFDSAPVSASWDAQQERIKASVETPEAERLIGRDGKTLESLQFLLTLILTRRFNSPVAVWVDTQGYWEKREKSLLAEAQKGVEEVKTTKRPFRMAPMEAPLRRLIHRSLAGNPDVITASEGEGSWRKIVLKPRGG